MSASAMSPFEEYRDGQILTLSILPESTLRVRIRKLHTHTLSTTMVVDILDEGEHPEKVARTAFLKLFDRRFATDLREEWHIDPWVKSDEEAYIESVESGTIDQFLHKLHHVENFVSDSEDDWDDAECEIFLADKSLKLYEAEVGTYKALMLHQGRHIPRLLAPVELDLTPADFNKKSGGGRTACAETPDTKTTGEEATVDKTAIEEIPIEEAGQEATDKEATPETKTVEDTCVEETAIEEPLAKEPLIKEPCIEELSTKGITIEDVTIEELSGEWITVDKTATGETSTEEVTCKETTVETKTAEDTCVKEKTIEVPLIKEVLIEEPLIKESNVEEPLIKEPIVEEPSIKETTIEVTTIEELTGGELAVKDTTCKETTAEEPTSKKDASEAEQVFGEEHTSSVNEVSNEQAFQPFKVKGVLLEYIEGYSMWDMLDHFPQSTWQGFVDEAIGIVHILSDYSIINLDVRPENFIVAPGKDGEEPRVYMIDFGCCKFRREDESDKEWGSEKNCRNEDGAIGARVQQRAKRKYGVELVYEVSERFAEWAEGEDEFEEGMRECPHIFMNQDGTEAYRLMPDGTIVYPLNNVP